jgi:hypothetical protein
MKEFKYFQLSVTFLTNLRSRNKKPHMKKIFLSLIVLTAFLTVNAQTDSLQQYTGKYKFPDGSPVTEITVTLEAGVLTANSAMGSSELKKTEGDVFEIVAYGGLATFKRNTESKITSVLIQVGDINMEGTKTEGLVINSSYHLVQRIQPIRR